MSILKTFFLLWITLLSITVFSQKNFRYKATISNIDSNGFYAFHLPSTILAKCNFDLSDLKIITNDNVEIPYVQKGDELIKAPVFTDFPIVSKTVHADGKMHVIIRSADSLYTLLGLEIQNTFARRTVNINGSNDGKQWFVVKENVVVSEAERYSANSYFVTIELPVTSYDYFDIAFTNKDILPANILKAGSVSFQNQLPSVKYDTIKTTLINQKDSAKVSYLQFSFPEPYPVQQILLNIIGPKYYQREAVINTHSDYNSWFTIHSETATWIKTNTKSSIYYIKIFNEDNPPLEYTSVTGLVKKTVVYAYLEKGKQYNLLFGNSLAIAPKYDLDNFKKLIQSDAPSVSITDIKINTVTAVDQPTTTSNKKIIWIAMGVILLVLLFITTKLTKEVNKKNADS
jgi:hypothetical protein